MIEDNIKTSSKTFALEIHIILCTVPDNYTAKNIAKNLLSKKLAACVTLFPKVTSLYYWNNKLQETQEIQLLIKSHKNFIDKIFIEIKKYHPYKIPELLTIIVFKSDLEYSLWIENYLT